MSEWISVKDRLPSSDGMVLAYIPGWVLPVTVGECRGSSWALVCNIGTYDDIVYESKPTHWMDLPEPPVKPSLDVTYDPSVSVTITVPQEEA